MMNGITWPPPSRSEQAQKPSDNFSQRAVNIIGMAMICALFIFMAGWWYVEVVVLNRAVHIQANRAVYARQARISKMPGQTPVYLKAPGKLSPVDQWIADRFFPARYH